MAATAALLCPTASVLPSPESSGFPRQGFHIGISLDRFPKERKIRQLKELIA